MYNAYNTHISGVTHPDEPYYMRVNALHNFSIAISMHEGEYHPLAPNTEMFASLAVAINMGLEMLEAPSGRQALCELGHTFAAKRAESSERIPVAGNLSRMNEYVDHFLERVRSHYPLVAVQREHDSVIASTIPGLGSTTLDNFHPEDAGIFSYNIDRVNSMVAAHEAYLGATRQRERKKFEERWQNFIFIFACATLHELAHLFTSYLSLGRTSSPPLGRGEGIIGGRWLEGRLYGGSLEIYSGQNHRPDMPDLLFLMDEDYTIRRIDSRAIIQFVSNPRQYQFPFPYIGQGITFEERRILGIQSTGSTSSPRVPLPHNTRAMRDLISKPGLLRYSIAVEDLRERSSRAGSSLRIAEVVYV